MDLIDHIEIYKLQGPEQKKPFWVSHFIVPNANELLIKIKTRDNRTATITSSKGLAIA